MTQSVSAPACGSLDTLFAPPERDGLDSVANQARLLEQVGHLSLINTVNDMVVILNDKRQIVAANDNFLAAFKADDISLMLGLRIGESMACIHAHDMEAGCGTCEHCSKCGATRAVLASLNGQTQVSECRILRESGASPEALDLLVKATPLVLDGRVFSIMALTDVSHEKRRRALERIFFHDLINIAGGLLGLTGVLAERVPGDLSMEAELVHETLGRLVREINAQRELAAAEGNDLEVEPIAMGSLDTIRTTTQIYSIHPAAIGRVIAVDPDSPNLQFTSDPNLLDRVLGNLLKNALEAQQPGDTVTVGCRAAALGDARPAIEFFVHNGAVMDRNVQLQVFQRSFSTKGTGRGLGLYGIKLLTERYLRGKVGFTTGQDGTTFTVSLPVDGPDSGRTS